MGSAGIAAWIALFAFPALLILGWARGDLGPKALALFLPLGALVWFGLPRISPPGANYVTPALAVLDIALVFIVFKGDVRLN